MKTKIINIEEFWDGENPSVTIKKIGFGQQNDIIDQVSDVKAKGKNNIEVSTKYGQLRTLTLLKCIVEAPFPITPEYVANELDAALGEYIFEQIDQFNTLKADKKKSLEVVSAV